MESQESKFKYAIEGDDLDNPEAGQAESEPIVEKSSEQETFNPETNYNWGSDLDIMAENLSQWPKIQFEEYFLTGKELAASVLEYKQKRNDISLQGLPRAYGIREWARSLGQTPDTSSSKEEIDGNVIMTSRQELIDAMPNEAALKLYVSKIDSLTVAGQNKTGAEVAQMVDDFFEGKLGAEYLPRIVRKKAQELKQLREQKQQAA
jgi:hypothetical protein